MANQATLQISAATVTKIKSYFGECLPFSNAYIDYVGVNNSVKVTIYKKIDKLGNVKASFQGPNADSIASKFGEAKIAEEKPLSKKAANNVPSFALCSQIGSDEVGTGDFFGPVVVCAAYASKADIETLKALGVTDSKKMSDDYILSIGERLWKTYDHSVYVLRNERYNEAYEKGNNMNMIKAKLHNAALSKVAERHPGAKFFQDQFAEEGLYYHYLIGEKKVLRGITFATKGESKFPSVALASVIARYFFLMEMKKMSEELGEEIPLGAGPKVDEFAKKLIEKTGITGLNKFAKMNFANVKKLS